MYEKDISDNTDINLRTLPEIDYYGWITRITREGSVDPNFGIEGVFIDSSENTIFHQMIID